MQYINKLSNSENKEGIIKVPRVESPKCENF